MSLYCLKRHHQVKEHRATRDSSSSVWSKCTIRLCFTTAFYAAFYDSDLIIGFYCVSFSFCTVSSLSTYFNFLNLTLKILHQDPSQLATSLPNSVKLAQDGVDTSTASGKSMPLSKLPASGQTTYVNPENTPQALQKKQAEQKKVRLFIIVRNFTD